MKKSEERQGGTPQAEEELSPGDHAEALDTGGTALRAYRIKWCSRGGTQRVWDGPTRHLNRVGAQRGFTDRPRVPLLHPLCPALHSRRPEDVLQRHLATPSTIPATTSVETSAGVFQNLKFSWRASKSAGPVVLAPADAVRTMLHGVRRARGPGCSGLTARKHSTCPPRDASRTRRRRVRQPGQPSHGRRTGWSNSRL